MSLLSPGRLCGAAYPRPSQIRCRRHPQPAPAPHPHAPMPAPRRNSWPGARTPGCRRSMPARCRGSPARLTRGRGVSRSSAADQKARHLIHRRGAVEASAGREPTKSAGKGLGRRLRLAKKAGDRRLYRQSRSNPKKGGPMSRSIVTKSLAAAAVMSLFAAHAATAQQTQNPPPTCTTHFVYFSTSSHALTPEDRNHIRDVAALMHSTPAFVATIVGKTDLVGSADFNAHLSQRRAEAVFEALVYANKVPEDRVQLHWTGERLPFVSTADEKAESQNRMVAIIVSNGASEHCGG